MTESPAPGPARRPTRRRADAERSRAAVLDAAIRLLGERPSVGMEAVAAAAGVTRQTVYAHFASRDALLAAVVDRLTERTMEAMDAAAIDEGPAADALVRLLDAAWRTFEEHPFVLRIAADPASAGTSRARARATTRDGAGDEAHETTCDGSGDEAHETTRGGSGDEAREADRARHEPVAERYERLIRRGQAAGEFDAEVPADWLVAATIALGHAAGEQVTSGGMPPARAAETLRVSVLRVLGARVPG
ncbi:TetR/AcrR family transcriptional regulator, partial [Streptomyces silaceus]|uniref:TetR/AcrR family transcriptional regulator n=1 Tax=Streptomyces silaceus TaxID=545123 RepID=UPI0006EB7928